MFLKLLSYKFIYFKQHETAVFKLNILNTAGCTNSNVQIIYTFVIMYLTIVYL